MESRDGTFDKQLWLAITNQEVETAVGLIENGADVNAMCTDEDGNSSSLLQVAIMKVTSSTDRLRVVQQLLRAGALVNVVDRSDAPITSTPLIDACRIGDEEIVKTLLNHGADINYLVTRNYRYPLACAARNNHWKLIELLVSNGAAVNGVDSSFTPLYVASASGCVDSVQALLDHGANPDQLGHAETPLCMASGIGCVEIARLLIARGANVNYCGYRGTPLMCAACGGHVEMVRFLIESGANLNPQNREEHHLTVALGDVVECGHEKVLRLLLDNQLTLSTLQIWHMVHKAIGAKQPRILSMLLNYLPPEFVRIVLPPLSAVSNDDAETMLLLIEAGVDLVIPDRSNKSCNAIFTAASAGKSHIVRLFIEKGFDVNVRDISGKSLLIAAAANGSLETVRELVERGADVYALDSEGRSAMDHALYGRHWEAVRYLSQYQKQSIASHSSIERHDCNTALHEVISVEEAVGLLVNGDDITAENLFGWRPLHYAAKQGLVELTELLIVYGAVIDAKDFAGNTALHLAAAHGLSITKALTAHLSSPAHLNIQNACGRTALHEAVQHGKYDVVMHLLEQGADAGLVDNWLNTAFHYADLQLPFFWSKMRPLFSSRKISDWTKPNLFGVSVTDRLQRYAVCTRQCNRTLIYSRCKTARDFEGDFLGNTELHCAFGVYSACKVFFPPADPVSTCAFLVNSENGHLTAQNAYGQSALHIARNASEVRACLQYGSNELLLTTDIRNRNFWHLLAIRENDPRDIVELIEQQKVDEMFTGLDAVDVFGRTPLHYAVANPKVEWYAKWLSQRAIHCAWMYDMYGRPPLHYVTSGRNLDSYIRHQILEAPGSSGTNKKVPNDALAMSLTNRGELGSSSLDSQINEFHRLRASHNQESLFTQSKATIFFKFNSIVEHIYNSRAEVISLRNCDSEKELILKIWQSHKFAYTNSDDDLSRARDTFQNYLLRIGSNLTNTNSSKILEDNERCKNINNTNQSPSEMKECHMFNSITEIVSTTMCRLAKRVGSKDPRFRCHVTPAGSGYEGTKVDFCDEFDFIVVLEHFSDICTVVDSLYSPEGFVTLQSVAGKTATCEEFFDPDNNSLLNTSLVKFRFEALVKQALYEPSFQQENDVLELVEVLSGENILYSFSLRRLGMNIKMKFMKPVNDQFLFHEVSVDIVPAICIPNYWPTNAVQDTRALFWSFCERLPDRRCYLVFDQPQRHRPWIPWTPPQARVDFSLFESDVIRSSPPVVRAACIVVKQIVRNFCDFRFFKSYAIKAALMQCIAAYADELSQTDWTSSTEVDPEQLVQWVQRIIFRMLCFVLQDFVPSVFMPGLKLPTCWFQTYLKFSHVHLFKYGLTHHDLVKVDFLESEKTKRMIDSQFEYIVKSYVISHLMYWSVLPNDATRHIYRLPIDPLREIDYWELMNTP